MHPWGRNGHWTIRWGSQRPGSLAALNISWRGRAEQRRTFGTMLQPLHVLRYTLIGVITTAATSLVQAQPCDCAATFDWMVKTFTENDAGFPTVLETKGTVAYEQQTTALRATAAKAGTVEDCSPVLSDWLNWFRHGHIGIWAKHPEYEEEPAPELPPVIKPIDMTEQQVRARFASKGYVPHAAEGIWSSGTLRFAILRRGKTDRFDAVILRTASEHKKPKDVLMELRQRAGSDTLEGTIYLTMTVGGRFVTAYSPLPVQAVVKGEDRSLLDAFGLYQRDFPAGRVTVMDSALFVYQNSRAPFALSLSDRTMYVRIPSFSMDGKAAIDSVLAANDARIREHANLIIDIRNGTGGGDAAYAGLIPYLYTTPIRGMDVAIRSTPMNADAYAGYARFYPDDTASANGLLRLAERLRREPGTFVPRDAQGRTVQVDSSFVASAMPKQVAILCNGGNGSTDEQFLLEARGSWKVKLFGQPTRGSIDVSNLNEVDSPDGHFAMAYAMSRSYRMPQMIIDDRGIQPDHFLDDSLPDDQWIPYVRSVLER